VAKSDRGLVLLADVPEGTEHIKRLLSPSHDLVMVHNLAAAMRLVENVDFDAIVAGIHFDDSRMIELLKAVRAEKRYDDKPFIVVRILPTTLQPGMEANSKQMATVLGATAYLTLDDAQIQANGHGSDPAVAERILTFNINNLISGQATQRAERQ
jgi:PleD family two-component response regulator